MLPKQLIVRMRDLGLRFTVIGQVFQKKTANAVRMIYGRAKILQELGEKPKLSKSPFDNTVRRQIKALVELDPQIPHRSIPERLRQSLPPETPVPSATTCLRIMKSTGSVRAKAVKRNLISLKNQQKRLEFALEYAETDDLLWDLVIWSDETIIRQAGALDTAWQGERSNDE
jgi:hypothetical protein